MAEAMPHNEAATKWEDFTGKMRKERSPATVCRGDEQEGEP